MRQCGSIGRARRGHDVRQGYQEILANAEQDLEYVSDFVLELSRTEETRKLWRAWSGFLEHYVKTVSALRRATDQGKSKAWSDGLKHQQKKDPILQFAFQSRNNASHVFEEKREAVPRSVNIGNFISVGGNSKGTLSNNRKIGPDGRVSKLPDGVLRTENGRYAGGTIPRQSVQEHEHFIVLKTVRNKSGVWQVPNQKTPREKQAIEIANYVMAWLEIKLSEAKELAKELNK